MIILDALEIEVFREIENERIKLDKKFKWNVIDYTSDLLLLQLTIEDPEELGSSLSYKDFISVTFWGTEFFKSSQGF